MNQREHFIALVKKEAPIFDRVLRAVPTDNADYRPDPKSPTALGLVNKIVLEFNMYQGFLTKDAYDLNDSQITVASPKEGADALKGIIDGIVTIAEGMSDDAWGGSVKMSVGGQFEWPSTHGDTAWGFLLDLIHHRGQLSTYLRAMGGKVPSIYGPSADDMGGM